MSLVWNGQEIAGLVLNGSTVSACYNGQLVWPVGPTPPYTPTKPYLVFRFHDASFNPNHVSGLKYYGTWTMVEGSAYNDWYWECDYFVNTGTGSSLYGWPAAFGSTSSPPVGKLTPNYLGTGNTCEIIGYGNLTVGTLESLDRTFAGCTYLISCVTIQTPNTLINVGGTFSECVNMEDGMLDQYTYWSTYGTNITNHSGTFANAGSDTVSGLAELDQIPVGWGGNLVPVSTLMTSSRVRWKSNYDTWKITGNAPTWTDVANGLYLFTEASVSAYAGVSMNRNRISKFNSLVTTGALYFYPCFMQHTSGLITWAVTTSLPNDHLEANEGNRDMPGTLDYNTYGPFEHEYGTYDSSADVYFCFLVTSVPISTWLGLDDANGYGVLYNSNFKTDGGFRWYF